MPGAPNELTARGGKFYVLLYSCIRRIENYQNNIYLYDTALFPLGSPCVHTIHTCLCLPLFVFRFSSLFSVLHISCFPICSDPRTDVPAVLQLVVVQ